MLEKLSQMSHICTMRVDFKSVILDYELEVKFINRKQILREGDLLSIRMEDARREDALVTNIFRDPTCNFKLIKIIFLFNNGNEIPIELRTLKRCIQLQNILIY